MYVGTPAQEQDFAQYRVVREDAQRLGVPLIVWAYPRGSAVEARGGKSSFYAVDYAARTASELGADVVKVNFPKPDRRAGVKAEYDAEFSSQQAVEAVVRSANRTLVLISGDDRVVRPGTSTGQECQQVVHDECRPDDGLEDAQHSFAETVGRLDVVHQRADQTQTVGRVTATGAPGAVTAFAGCRHIAHGLSHRRSPLSLGSHGAREQAGHTVPFGRVA
jgi:hypothetical protein